MEVARLDIDDATIPTRASRNQTCNSSAMMHRGGVTEMSNLFPNRAAFLGIMVGPSLWNRQLVELLNSIVASWGGFRKYPYEERGEIGFEEERPARFESWPCHLSNR
jgi:1,6-anhydro-N-acetylmuramate kinase